MNLAALQIYAELIALIGYPSLATLSLIWCGICLIRYWNVYSSVDLYLVVLLALFTSGFSVVSLSLSSVHVFERDAGMLLFRILFALAGITGWLFTIRYLVGLWKQGKSHNKSSFGHSKS